MDLPIIWAVIIAFAIMMYVVLDGFDLGIGMLFSVIHDEHDRDLMMSTVLPVWDGNETWLVLGAACLYGAFPVAYSTLLPILYLPIFIMLIALVFRGVSFEFRFKAHQSRWIWDVCFCLGSFVAVFMQGILLGAFVKGFPPEVNQIVPEYHWFDPYAIFCGFVAVFAYLLMGAVWLIRKTEGELQNRIKQITPKLIAAVVALLVILSFWTLYLDPYITNQWLEKDRLPFMVIIPILSVVSFLWLVWGLKKHHDLVPFLATVALFFLSYVGFIINVWPYAIPRLVTFRDAAAPESSLKFMLIGVVILLPVLLTYTYYSYHVFRGKVRDVHRY